MTRYIWAYATALVALAVIDGVWLGFIARDFYKTQLGSMMLDKPNWAPAAIFYLLYPAALTFFVISPALREQSVLVAILAGGFFGLTAYATYDMSNWATLRGWPATLSLVDVAWGTVLTAAVCAVSWLVTSRFA